MQGTQLLGIDKDGSHLTIAGSRLVVSRGPDKGRALRLEKEEIVVGTSAACDLTLTDETVSRAHFRLQARESGWLLVDLESTNGTLVDGRRVREIYLRPRDQIDLGRTRIRLSSEREPVGLPLSSAESFGSFLGRSAPARRLFALAEKLAPTETTVLITGETGTGKDTLAEAIHQKSPRAGGPFGVIDCGALPPGLIESELFGHEKGAFTGASSARLGAMREANHGTLFIDEIGELPREFQPRLLRAIDKREVRPVGSERTHSVDVRILAATNRDLRVEVNHGRFREDLFYRLNVMSLHIPPLRERADDIPLLATHFWRSFTGDERAALPESFLTPLLGHSWPGNVRELKNRLERAAVLDELAITSAGAARQSSFGDAKQIAIDAFERTFLTQVLSDAGGNVSEAARRARMDRVYLSRLMRKHGLHRA